MGSMTDWTLMNEMLKNLVLIRRVEEKIRELFPERQMRCPIHLSIGAEASAVGVCRALGKEDLVFSNHRSHAHYLAKGGSVEAMFSELYGRQNGCSGGMGGSMHLLDTSCGFMGTSSIVGGIIPIAVGAAWQLARQKSSRVVAVFFGDGATEEGVFYESLNFAVLHNLRILFVCEDNGLATYTPLILRQPKGAIVPRASAFLPCWEVERGYDCHEVYQTAKDFLACDGPGLIYILVNRFTEHVGVNYETEVGVVDEEAMKRKVEEECPLSYWEKWMRENMQLSGEDCRRQLDHATKEADEEIFRAVENAKISPFPEAEEINRHVWEVRRWIRK